MVVPVNLKGHFFRLTLYFIHNKINFEVIHCHLIFVWVTKHLQKRPNINFKQRLLLWWSNKFFNLVILRIQQQGYVLCDGYKLFNVWAFVIAVDQTLMKRVKSNIAIVDLKLADEADAFVDNQLPE